MAGMSEACKAALHHLGIAFAATSSTLVSTVGFLRCLVFLLPQQQFEAQLQLSSISSDVLAFALIGGIGDAIGHLLLYTKVPFSIHITIYIYRKTANSIHTYSKLYWVIAEIEYKFVYIRKTCLNL